MDQQRIAPAQNDMKGTLYNIEQSFRQDGRHGTAPQGLSVNTARE